MQVSSSCCQKELIDIEELTTFCKKGAQVVAYTAIFSCGNYQGVARLAKAKGLAVPIAHKKAVKKMRCRFFHKLMAL
ncbi:hypothetical protein LOK49_LG02G02182 [Camellia lanceoleosa]|uniref:Uncharacterized protein n=1 Tax=Camellia lanceoleosa TaxID=1840588 RepID=A0ACC0IJZ4_9ERIC|nr:hypothetical protein LOK49_LG02G02182 [Camellia lanceoleosa]